jgi:hypothetical protein
MVSTYTNNICAVCVGLLNSNIEQLMWVWFFI